MSDSSFREYLDVLVYPHRSGVGVDVAGRSVLFPDDFVPEPALGRAYNDFTCVRLRPEQQDWPIWFDDAPVLCPQPGQVERAIPRTPARAIREIGRNQI